MWLYRNLPKSIFVLGIQRSGTTWLGNILSQHPNIAAVCIKGHGIFESIYFSHFIGKFGNLRDARNFKMLVEMFARSNYFLLTGLKKEILYRNRPQTYPDFFRLLMDNFARMEKKDFWVEKSPDHTPYVENISEYFPDAKFIAIKRNVFSVIKSALQLRKNRRILQGKMDLPFLKLVVIFYYILRYVIFYKHIEHFLCISKTMKIVTYEKLRLSRKQVILNLCEFLGIKFAPQMLERRYRPSTSFRSINERKKAIFSPIEKQMIKRVVYLLNCLPYPLFWLIYRVEKVLVENKVPSWCFSSKIRHQILKSRYLA